MAIRNVIKIGNQTLRKKSKPVESFDEDLHKLLDDMRNTMIEKIGIGIAAVQVGVLRRAIVIELDEGEYLEIINPEIIKSKGSCVMEEGCLSVPGFHSNVRRPKYVKIKAQDREGNEFIFEAEDIVARCICHEMDHLDGILFVDHSREGKDYRSRVEKNFED